MAEEQNIIFKVGAVSAEEILEKIRRCDKVEYNDVNIKGPLEIAKVVLPKDENGRIIIKSEININGSNVQGNVDFSNSVFYNIVNISSTNITGDALFSMTTFNREISIVGSQFDGSVSFAGSEFTNDAIFRGTRFSKSAWFNNAKFKGIAQFDGAEFYLDINFEEARFEYFAYFRTEFKSIANFRRAIFKKKVEFIRARFLGDVFFIRAKFDEDVNLNDSEIYLDIYLTNATFKGKVYFSGAQFANRIFVSWDSIKSHIAYDGPAYLYLVKNYNNLEIFDDADRCYYQYRELRRGTLNFKQKLTDLISLLALGYGVRPDYPLILGGLIIIFFALIYSSIGNAFSIESLKNATIISAAVFATQTGMDNFEGLLYILSIIEAILGIFVISCFLVSLAKKTLR